jgi:hypothetical protein
MRRCFFLLFIVPFIISNIYGSDIYSGAGSKGLSFLKIGLGARAGALGEAYVALANDATAPMWNPAGLTQVDGRDVLFTHNQWFQDARSEFVGTALHFDDHGFGFGLLVNTVGNIEKRTNTGTLIGTFSAHDVALTGAYARRFGEFLSLGFSLKMLYEKMYMYSSSGFAFDLGMRISPGLSNVSLGAVIQNIGKMGAMRNEETPLPLMVRAGMAYRVSAKPLTGDILVTADVSKASDYRTTVHSGLEYQLDRRFALRGGYLFGHEERGASVGVGLGFKVYRLDYAFVPFDYDLGETHRVTFGISL